jgi:hypothetical protein
LGSEVSAKLAGGMDAAKLRAWWSHRQGLDGSLNGQTEADVLASTGWARSVGGTGPYLGLFARSGAPRESVDRAVAELAIHELPSARGCTYVVPQCDFALALRAGQPFADGDMKVARKLGVTDKEVDKLGVAVIDALGKQALEPDELKSAAGGVVRNLGEEGKKKGVTTTLPLALGRLQAAGEIRRIPVNGRLDQQRYRYALWRPNPLDNFRLSDDDVYTELARRYFAWTAPTSLAEFQWFSGLGVKAAKAAIEPLGLVAIEDRLITPDLRDQVAAFRAPAKPQYSLVSSIDGILLLRRNLKSLLAEEDWTKTVATEKGRAAAGGLTDLPSHAILDRGRVIGLWEYDPAAESIAWMTFGKPDTALESAIGKTEAYVKNHLGDARSFSLDSPKSRAPRIEALRALAKLAS